MYKISTFRVLFLIGTVFCKMSASDEPTWSEKARCLTSLFGRCVVGKTEFAYRQVAEPIGKGVRVTQQFVADHPTLVTAAAGTVGLVAMATYSERDTLRTAGAGPADSRGIVKALFAHPKAYVAGGLAAGTVLVTSKEQKEVIIDKDLVATRSELSASMHEVGGRVSDLERQKDLALSQSQQSLDAARGASSAIQQLGSVIDSQSSAITSLTSGLGDAERGLESVSAKVSAVSRRVRSLEDKVELAAPVIAADCARARALQVRAGKAVNAALSRTNALARGSRNLSKDVAHSNVSIRGLAQQLSAFSDSVGGVQGAIISMEGDLRKAQELGQDNIRVISSLTGCGSTGETGV